MMTNRIDLNEIGWTQEDCEDGKPTECRLTVNRETLQAVIEMTRDGETRRLTVRCPTIWSLDDMIWDAGNARGIHRYVYGDAVSWRTVGHIVMCGTPLILSKDEERYSRSLEDGGELSRWVENWLDSGGLVKRRCVLTVDPQTFWGRLKQYQGPDDRLVYDTGFDFLDREYYDGAIDEISESVKACRVSEDRLETEWVTE